MLTLSSDPMSALNAATKQYVDKLSTGINIYGSVVSATETPLPSSIYSNGTSAGSFDTVAYDIIAYDLRLTGLTGLGVGATLTSVNNENINTAGIGSYHVLVNGDKVLIKDQVNTLENGVYVVTDTGSSTSKWILTRASDYDNSTPRQVHAGGVIYVQRGVLDGTQWVEISVGTGVDNTTIIGVDSITYNQFSGAGTIQSGAGIDVTGNTISNTGVLSLVAGQNIAISNTVGNITISVTGTVVSANTANNISNGVAGSLLYQSGLSTTVSLPPGSDGQVLSIGSSTPIWSDPVSINPPTYRESEGAACIANSVYMILGSTTFTNMQLPPNPVMGEYVRFVDMIGNWATYNWALSGNGSNIMGSADNMTTNISDANFMLIYSGDTAAGWRLIKV
jgi:hypothetical protein